MKPGDLVKITRPRLGMPKGTVGLIVYSVETTDIFVESMGDPRIHMVDLIGSEFVGVSRTFLSRDLEVISESR
tara:strand:+ start:104 stop:322 length:219 start_codon:yes stop_codon:yes gene_type:complete